MPKGHKQSTLCWDCKRANGGQDGCSWSKWFIPVEGWDAEPTQMRIMAGNTTDSYIVMHCPQFLRDGYDCGQRRVGEGSQWAKHFIDSVAE